MVALQLHDKDLAAHSVPATDSAPSPLYASRVVLAVRVRVAIVPLFVVGMHSFFDGLRLLVDVLDLLSRCPPPRLHDAHDEGRQEAGGQQHKYRLAEAVVRFSAICCWRCCTPSGDLLSEMLYSLQRSLLEMCYSLQLTVVGDAAFTPATGVGDLAFSPALLV